MNKNLEYHFDMLLAKLVCMVREFTIGVTILILCNIIYIINKYSPTLFGSAVVECVLYFALLCMTIGVIDLLFAIYYGVISFKLYLTYRSKK